MDHHRDRRWRGSLISFGELLVTTRFATAVITAALLGVGAPGLAADLPAMSAIGRPAPLALGNPDVERFMTQRADAPVWFRAGGGAEAVASLAAILRRAPLDGLASGPALAEAVEAAGRDAASGDAKAVARADRTLSAAWLMYLAALDAPLPGFTYSDPSLAPRPAPGAMRLLQLAALAPSLTRHIESASFVNPIYAELRDAAWASLQSSGAAPDARLLTNLGRARILPRTGRFLVVNAATQRLQMVDNGQVVDSMKVIVGRPDAQTPMLASTIWYATVNPYWYVPLDLTQNIVAKKMQAKTAGAYWKEKRYEVISDFGPNPTMADPKSIDWKAVEQGTQTVYLRQLPGKGNSMGKIKFPFPNEIGVYLHDTDLPQLFAKDPRTLSNGCIRLEDAQRLGRWLLGRDAVTGASAEPEQHVALPRGVPVFLTYITAKPVAGGQIAYTADPYGRDGTAGKLAER